MKNLKNQISQQLHFIQNFRIIDPKVMFEAPPQQSIPFRNKKKNNNLELLKIMSHCKCWGDLIIINGAYVQENMKHAFSTISTLPVVEKLYLCNNGEPRIIQNLCHIDFDNIVLLNLKGNNIESLEILCRANIGGQLAQISLEDNQICQLRALRKLGGAHGGNLPSVISLKDTVNNRIVQNCGKNGLLADAYLPCLKELSISNRRPVDRQVFIQGFHRPVVYGKQSLRDFRWIAKLEPRFLNIIKAQRSPFSNALILPILLKRNKQANFSQI